MKNLPFFWRILMSFIAALIALPSLIPIIIIHYPDYKRRGLEIGDLYIYYFLCVEDRLNKYWSGICGASMSMWFALIVIALSMPPFLCVFYVCAYLYIEYIVIRFMLVDIYPDKYYDE